MTKNIVIGVLVAATLLFGGLYVTHGNLLGSTATGAAHWQLETFLQGLQIGQGGSQTSFVTNATCNLSNDGTSFAATSTKQFFCTVAGVKAGDLVVADLPVGAGANNGGLSTPNGGFVVTSAYATTTNTVGVTLLNLTGAATSSYPQATTSVEYRVLR